MGGAGVANGNYTQAGFLNPALMARFEDRDHIGIVFPSLGIEVADSDDLVDSLDQFQADYDAFEQALENSVDAATLEQARANLTASFVNIEGDLTLDGTVYAKLAIPTSFLSSAIYVNSRVNLLTGPRLNESDLALIANATSIDALDGLASTALVIGNAVTDFGLVLAKRFELAGNELALGVTPKLQRVDTFAYAATIDDFDEDDYDSQNYSNDDSFSNVDVGVTYSNARWSVGLVARNLISQELSAGPIQLFNPGVPLTLEYEFEPSATAGFGFNSRFFAFALDVDLTPTRYLQLSEASQQQLFGEEIEHQFARAGIEFDLFRNAQLRIGYRHDLEGTFDDAYTAGIGLSPFGRVHLNINAVYTDENNFGAGLQFAFTF